MLIISQINDHPIDVYVWSSILIIGAIIFIVREIRLHKPNDMKTTKNE